MTLPTTYQQFIHASRYARWLPEEDRRETWEETVKRYFDFFEKHLGEHQPQYDAKGDREWLEPMVLDLSVMPSMRCLMTAGPALERDNVCAYNCAYRAVDDIRAFDEILYILMCGTGVGFSVERQYITKLPIVANYIDSVSYTIIVSDSRRGWAEALRELIAQLYTGVQPKWDLSRVRPEGAPLKTMGGHASGPAPLDLLFKNVCALFKGAVGRKLNSLECHDLVCMIADCVIVGGVRRSALLSLSNLSDQRMRDAKSGDWWEKAPWRALANNSVAYTETPEPGQFMAEWLSLYNSKSGERGIFNRRAAMDKARSIGRRTEWDDGTPIEFGTNPCSEIILRSKQFCNLTEVVCREGDSHKILAEKVKAATTLGVWQSTLTKFKYITRDWISNTEEERLLGVSLTGMQDCYATRMYSGGPFFPQLRKIAKDTADECAILLEIPFPAAVTCVKPSGTVSQLVNSASGLHKRYAPYYIRRVRQNTNDPLTQFMVSAGFPHEPDLSKREHLVFSFPIKAGVSYKHNAIEFLDYWLSIERGWCDHKASVTVEVQEDEWVAVAAWVYRYFDVIGGISFLPSAGNHIYQQAPFEEVTEEKYNELLEKMPKNVDFSRLVDATGDKTEVPVMACMAGGEECTI